MPSLSPPPPKPYTPMSFSSSEGHQPFPLTATDWIIVFNTHLPKYDKKTRKAAEKAQKNAHPGHANNGSANHEFLENLKHDVRKAWGDVLHRLLSVGLKFRIQDWGNGRLAIFLWCPESVLAREVYRSRVLDWLNDSGISALEPPSFSTNSEPNPQLPPLTPAERLRLVYELLTTPTYEGGAGLTMNEDVVGKTDAVGGRFVEAIFAPHDRDFCKQWVKNWAKKWLLTETDIHAIREYAGEKVAYYFAFLRFYSQALIPATIMGLAAYFLDYDFSPYYGAFIVLWSILFIALWSRRADHYATLWGTRNYSKIEKIRPEFRPTSILIDPITEERLPYYPIYKRWALKCLVTVPITIAFITVLGLVVFGIVASDLYFHKFYDGKWRDIMAYVPTIVYSASIPTFHAYYTTLARKMSNMENLPTDTQHSDSFTQKLFTFNSLVAFFALFAESYIFIPFSNTVGSYLHAKGLVSSLSFSVTPETLRARVVYLMVTGQVINAVQEVLVPLATGMWGRRQSGLRKSKEEKMKETEEERWVRRVRGEYERPDYDVELDYSEMIIQFGYVTLFSAAWPLAPFFCLVNNFIELRSDAFKIYAATRRPTPHRADNIGPWIKNLTLISWLSSITVPSLVILYHKWELTKPASLQTSDKLPLLLTTLIVSEHIFLVLYYVFGQAANQLPTKGIQNRKRAEFELKKRYLLRAGIDVLAGRHGGVVRWSGKNGKVKDGEEEDGGDDGSVLYGVALGELQKVVG